MNDINWNDWLTREQITLDDCLLLAMGENPNASDINTDWWKDLSMDDYRERRAEAVQWFKSSELKARKVNNNGSVEYKNINPLSFFNLARSNDWDLPEPLHDWLDNLEKQQCVTWCGDIQPLEPLTDEDKQNYSNRAAWSWVDAIYILQGYKPVYQLSTEQVRSHFPDSVKYFTDSLELGTIGKEITQAGQRIFIDSPANWQAFWQNIHKTPEPKAEAVGSEEGKKQGDNERDLTKWFRETWEKEGQPNGTPFFNALKNHVNQQGSPIREHYTTGPKGAGIRWNTGSASNKMTKKNIQTMVSKFKKEIKQKAVNS
ncbi:hypothetical protein [Methylomonas rivi]|uniref:Uncharacterized protein n=1 Tax=Methylomonas rivi TaxID=2952226 RepID=A0ABT1U8H8_9GAMM|nr:hypothetical protein [Methylomonas sp. WSC-6]MCQ8130147.1 hypothetical protein [Methylomonas sp. WSC-6]